MLSTLMRKRVDRFDERAVGCCAETGGSLVSESTPSNSLDRYRNLAERALAGEAPSEAEAVWILEGDDVELLPLLQAAYEPRRAAFGRKVMVQVLNNVQNGLCPED